ncbi:MAG: DNA topoisomerase [Planctomycetota bacterium]|jgi:DNA topoisomerase-3
MQLIIAEKPSVAADLARSLPGTFEQKEGFWESSDTVISWAIGHLLELSEPEDYDPELKNWSLKNLPVLPDPFLRRPRKGQSSQLRLLKKIAKRGDITSLVNACDAAREGELIFREIADYLQLDVPIERLWLQSMTAASIREAFEHLRPGKELEGLSAAAYCRAEADWLIGINATRGITRRLKGRRERGVWSAGRVQTPTLALLVHRESRVLAHVPVPFWRLKGSFTASGLDYEGQYRSARSGKDVEKVWKEEDAKAIAEACKGQPTSVVEKITSSKRAVPPLHSLTSLQKEGNSRFGLSARRTLQAAQRLYEGHKVLTYPRTDANCLPEDYRGHVDEVLETLASGAMAEAFSESERHVAIVQAAKLLKEEGLNNTKRNFNDAGVSDHFAIIPTGKVPDSPLGGDDAKVYELVMRRFLGSFLTPSRWEKVVRETSVAAGSDTHRFFTEASRMVEPGWQLVDRRPKASEQLGELGVEPGETASGKVKDVEVDEDATRPPKRYTEAGLLKAMETASDQDLDAWDDIEDDEAVQMMKDKGLGTPATRADIIEALIAKGYVLRSGKTLRASAKGITLVDFLERLHADDLAKASKTAEMESHLYQVENGQRSREDYMSEIATSVTALVEKLRDFSYEALYEDEEVVGSCPKDGHDIREGLKGYRCVRKAKGTQYKLTIKSLGKEAKVPLKELAEILQKELEKRADVAAVEPDVKRTNAYLTFTI